MQGLASCSTLSPIHYCEPLPALRTKSLSALIVKKKNLGAKNNISVVNIQ